MKSYFLTSSAPKFLAVSGWINENPCFNTEVYEWMLLCIHRDAGWEQICFSQELWLQVVEWWWVTFVHKLQLFYVNTEFEMK